ncbi:Glycosyltransferase family 9 (heptosyltransferase) [Pseudobutyrivibrio ruminis]|uniref:Glycosyltransferase family 9 (Heptosyltransferase) n=1 Tax=Pseudobutyrivibrio ruminis TaxID=46206 RepID=A0A1H7F7W7_9FIRM|nr:glycosyltransferase family 9 protein [Pseudobutyrivibrio ruminis]SEK21844.1 Glycosyltransferase family 9 (heptosyltransferase) [Pseudobutyrivibrio ruminis]
MIIVKILKSFRRRGIRGTLSKIKRWILANIYRSDFSADAKNKIDFYKRKSKNHYSQALKMVGWLFVSLFRRYESDKKNINVDLRESLTIEDFDKESSKLNVGFLFGGGYGDLLIAANYIKKFKDKFSDVEIDVFIQDHNGQIGAANTIFFDGLIIRHLYPKLGYEAMFGKYDLFIQCNRVPNAKYVRFNRLAELNPELLAFYFQLEKYKKTNERYYSHAGITDGQSAITCIMHNKKRIQQSDVYGLLGISEEYEYPLPINVDENEYLSSIGLNNCKYITVHRGSDVRYSKDSTKLWPTEYYNILIKMIKKQYKDVAIVELGVSEDRCPIFSNIDVNLVGKTTMEEVKVILKKSLIHIDCEGGMVHLRHALKAGKSIVVFGPTDERFFGYEENYNVRGNGCASPCEWVVRGWNVECIRGKIPFCMASITPETVFGYVQKEMGFINGER